MSTIFWYARKTSWPPVALLGERHVTADAPRPIISGLGIALTHFSRGSAIPVDLQNALRVYDGSSCDSTKFFGELLLELEGYVGCAAERVRQLV